MREYFKYYLLGLVILVIAGGTFFILKWVFLPVKILDPDQGLQRWRWFYDTREALNATESNILVAQNSIDTFLSVNPDQESWDFAQNNEFSRLLSVKSGYITHYNNLVSQYNSKMRDITRNWSAPPDLPTRLENFTE